MAAHWSLSTIFCVSLLAPLHAECQHSIYLYGIAAGPHEELKIFFPVCRSLFLKLLGTCFSSIQEPFSHCHSVLFQDARKNASCGLRDHKHRLTDWPCPSHSRDTDTLHVPTLPRGAAMPRSYHVNNAVHSRDSYKTENADDGKAKSRDTRTTNCEAGMRERPANLFILALPCQSRHASLGFTYVSFSHRSLHTSPFSHFPT